MLRATIYVYNMEPDKKPYKIDVPAETIQYHDHGVLYMKGSKETIFYPYTTIHHITMYAEEDSK